MRPSNTKKKYMIAAFDFDGTLIDTERIYPYIHKEVLRELGVSEDGIAYITYESWQENVANVDSHVDVPHYLIQRHGLEGITDGEDFRARRNRIEVEYFEGKRKIHEIGNSDNYLIKSTINDMKSMHAEGTKCVVVSFNYAKVIIPILRAIGIGDLISDYYTHCVVEQLKDARYDRCYPKEKTYSHLIEQAGKDASSCIVYDDFLEHIEAARRLGMDAVLVSSEHRYPRTVDLYSGSDARC